MNLFGWRRRSEGFEWREHVRTTILLRRAERQRRIGEAREAALARVQDVRDRGLEAGRAGVNAVADGASKTASSLGARLGRAIAHGAKIAWGGLGAAGTAVRQTVSHLDLARFVPERREVDTSDSAANTADGSDRRAEQRRGKEPAGERLAARVRQARDHRQDDDARPAKPADIRPAIDAKKRWPGRPQLTLTPRTLDIGKRVVRHSLQAAAIVGVILVGGQALQSRDPIEIAAFVPTLSAPAEVINGPASALTGDRLRIAGRIVSLDGVAAPWPAQKCRRGKSRSWRCGVTAKSELAKLVGKRDVVCEIVAGANGAKPAEARCRASDKDLSTALLTAGHVFATSNANAADRESEDAAKQRGVGIWAGENVHPTVWREKTWEEASERAPDGCPIRGYTRRGKDLYVMPWSASYGSKSARRTKEWFCSAEDAERAGYQPADSAS